MSHEDYIVGQRPRFDFQIRDDHVLVDPSTLTFMFEKPDGVVTTYVYGVDAELVKDATGKFHVELTLDQAGTWIWRQESIGIVTATQGKFRVGEELL